MGTRVMNEYSKPPSDHGSLAHKHQIQDETHIVSRRSQLINDPGAGRSHESDQIQKIAGQSIGFLSVFAEHVLSHPCIVLRRQCQVHHAGAWYHLTPISLLQTVVNLQRTQGGMTLWKGLGGVYVVKGVNLMSESVLGEVTSFPREVSRHSSLKRHGLHLLLKSLTFAVMTPFYAASLVETVQSDIASERPGLIDVLFEGVTRVRSWGQPQTSRLVPVWHLALPTIVFQLTRYILSSIAQFTVTTAMHLEQEEMREQPGENGRAPSVYETYFPDLLASFTGGLMADMITYPLETVLHRLYVQGTRTIIDNTDTGSGVVPIISHYDGVFNCFKRIFEEEGIQGFYKGFGALIAQYAIHALILRLAKFMFEYLSKELRKRQDQRALVSSKHEISETGF